MNARVFVTPKKGVLDPQGKAILQALHALGFTEVEEVRMGKLFEIRVADDRASSEEQARLEEMCSRLLSNTIIEDFAVELNGGGAGHGQ